MKKTVLILLFLTSSYLISYGQSMPTKKEQYDFLRWYVHHKYELAQLSDTTILLLENETARSLNRTLSASSRVTKGDCLYIKRQLKIANLKTVIDTSSLKGVAWRINFSIDALQSYISLPIFTQNKKIAFINYRHYCGWLCGRETIEVYSKTKNGKWMPADSFFHFGIVTF